MPRLNAEMLPNKWLDRQASDDVVPLDQILSGTSQVNATVAGQTGCWEG